VAVFWNLVLAIMVLMLWWYALRAAFIADRRKKVFEKLEAMLRSSKAP
jgi:hypothetical protein